MLGGIFGKKRRAEAVTFLPGVAQEHRDPTGEAIAAGRYWIFAPESGGHAVLLLGTSPRLVASVVRERTESGSSMIVEWVCEASDDHRHQLAIDNVHLSCRRPEAGTQG